MGNDRKERPRKRKQREQRRTARQKRADERAAIDMGKIVADLKLNVFYRRFTEDDRYYIESIHIPSLRIATRRSQIRCNTR